MYVSRDARLGYNVRFLPIEGRHYHYSGANLGRGMMGNVFQVDQLEKKAWCRAVKHTNLGRQERRG